MHHPIEYHYTPTEVAEKLGLSLNAIYSCIKHKKLKAVRIIDPGTFRGYRWRIAASELEKWLNDMQI